MSELIAKSAMKKVSTCKYRFVFLKRLILSIYN